MLKETRVKCDPSLKASLSEQNGGELSRILLLVYSREPLSLGSLAGMHEKVSTYSLVFDGSNLSSASTCSMALVSEFQPRWQNWTNWILLNPSSPINRGKGCMDSRRPWFSCLVTDWESR
ncbi:hypothetical protein DSO57_1026872 [Entomophthora muscae]|uniref:Uncharacterized protein n=1 Tax=Entomophthora muscae TaxID=34485 RepID=A0ACC2T1U2_9FUNG|nr:hypothetical protein DSO57_1026872 [Entomophthora muscae]